MTPYNERTMARIAATVDGLNDTNAMNLINGWDPDFACQIIARMKTSYRLIPYLSTRQLMLWEEVEGF